MCIAFHDHDIREPRPADARDGEPHGITAARSSEEIATAPEPVSNPVAGTEVLCHG